MLVLSRKPGESLLIGNDVVLTVVEVRGNRVRIGIEAPKEVKVLREELPRTAAEILPGETGRALPGG